MNNAVDFFVPIPNTVTIPALDSVLEEFQGKPDPDAGSISTLIPSISGSLGSAETVPIAETEDDKSGSLNKVDGERIEIAPALNILARVVDSFKLIDGDITHREEKAEIVESAILVSEQAFCTISRNKDSIAPIITVTHVSEGALVEKGNYTCHRICVIK
jgi:hypothetical protein